ncbi:hypothetical protein [Streptococcus ovuberis]|uniref:Uncharacterized protein n=1 Tax=Streptococcus ovuberis TaxID=1936207 RepID=A0A7X6N0A6_9STRE|nr:hypothetical protein [Streptococcus ovuberis]NKZ19704.1 hypothetical protein [Streptococcus ovuberis]
MSEIKRIDTEMTISDLRLLGRQGNATARLDDGTTLLLKPDRPLKPQMAYVAGELLEVMVPYSYIDIYSQIRTVKRGDVLIARRSKFGDRTILRLTGQGFVRPPRKSRNR